MAELQKFSFDTVFDADGGIAFQAPRPKRTFSAEEVEQIRRKAFAEGEQAAHASIAAQQQLALAGVAAACHQALPKLAEVAHEHRVTSARLSLACARAIAGAALDRFPEAPLQAALASLSQEIEAAPRLVVTAAPDLAERIQGVLSELAGAAGYAGAIQVKPDAGLPTHAFGLDFGDGQAAFDPEAAAARVTAALEEALAAEGLHAEPLIPGAQTEPEG
ncbi:FliH/SctL family protein [Phenylobacterium soli]|uniref:Flagellar assembly protein FliH n=1 Tax=Phenylobacterium soli TaxID=2170551 RepID=A0A328AKP6_9CAUL|nr:flagellar assembly protein FliH [Phenylobacterium soli]RAK54606.1 flagellar assembly protein FliH [Phenylobacterium soli]